MKPLTTIVLGAGGRGNAYARYAEHYPEEVQVVAVAEPNDAARRRMAETHRIPEERQFRDWQELLSRPKLADTALICTQDRMHRDPAVALSGLGYHLLLEKPMAPEPQECRDIVAAVQRNGVLLAVCHGMRYTQLNRTLKRLLDSGLIGKIRTIQLLEPVGYWHQAHSFVRGHWRNSVESSPMLLAKSCHDLDFLNYLVPARCTRVSSFGQLSYFRKENQPAGAADRCTDCPAAVESRCAYSAIKIYLKDFGKDLTGWPVGVLTKEGTPEAVRKALETGPYGRCVFACDNDVVDHQITNLEFADGAAASFTMTAFTKHTNRETLVMGDQGTLRCCEGPIEHFDFLTNETRRIEPDSDPLVASGHGGGDFALMHDFLAAVREDDPSRITSGPEVSLESHLIVFAAEESRRNGTVVEVK